MATEVKSASVQYHVIYNAKDVFCMPLIQELMPPGTSFHALHSPMRMSGDYSTCGSRTVILLYGVMHVGFNQFLAANAYFKKLTRRICISGESFAFVKSRGLTLGFNLATDIVVASQHTKLAQEYPNTNIVYAPHWWMSLAERTHTDFTGRDDRFARACPNPRIAYLAFNAVKPRDDLFLRISGLDVDNKDSETVERWKQLGPLGRTPQPPLWVTRVEPKLCKATDRHAVGYLDKAVKLYANHDMALVCENEEEPGYITEKLVNALLARVTNINYVGTEDVFKYFKRTRFARIGLDAKHFEMWGSDDDGDPFTEEGHRFQDELPWQLLAMFLAPRTIEECKADPQLQETVAKMRRFMCHSSSKSVSGTIS